ncbi:T9SS type A sorting domain-containing protein [Flavobacterium sp. KACC 22758]|uniref:T9SS type A sorting domain-containing protein n=1 Tax=Flavobacterium sp. KACC 22758 TaxID=3025667 RepID=UPI002365D57B|nr:T9SS type A sorting domain-containing protein [Flavobacterium sp. KACC 22758]WDF60606.1 T9SS type A sorting domain-containing protein [Flavobacterium sp. KACC 22758]
MKKFYLLVILLISVFGFSQTVGTYSVIAKLYIKPGGGSYGGSCRNDVRVNLIYNDATRQIISQDLSSIPSNSYTFYTNTLHVPATSIPTKIRVTSSRNWKRSLGGCGGNGSFNDDAKESTAAFSCLTSYNDIVRWWEDQLTIENIPELKVIQAADNALPTDTPITIYSNTGFARSEYNWQYTFNPTSNPNDWIDFPAALNGSDKVTISAKSLLADAGKYHGQTIYFRQKACNTYSTPVNYVIRQSAPLMSSVPSVETTCFDSADGKLVVKFDRPLIDKEKFTFSIMQLDEKGVPMEVLCSSQDDENIVLDNTNSYKFPCDFAAGKYALSFIGSINGNNTNPPIDPQHPYIFDVTSPTPVDFSLTATNVNCYGSKDGTLTINASGGSKEGYQYSLDNGNSWIPFTDVKSTKEVLTGLFPIVKPSITYSVIVKDKKGCIAKQGANTKVLTETISEPLSPLALNYTFKKNPTFYGAENGIITASVSGGTIKDDNSYDFVWKNSKGDILTATGQYNSTDKTYNITLENIPEGEYKLTVTDKNYGKASNKTGCSVIEASESLTQPKQIKITLTETQSISCNTENLETDADKFSDGILTAAVRGGIQFEKTKNGGLPYIYTWSKKLADGTWEVMSEVKDSVAINLPEGTYAVNVEDANGIKQGEYNTTDIIKEIPEVEEISEPAKLELSFDSENVSCYEGNNGWAVVNVTGGTLIEKNGIKDYKYSWYNRGNKVADTQKISQLIEGTYYIEIEDSKGCIIKDSITITQPSGRVEINYPTIDTPTFAGASNGKIVAEITGGTAFDPALNDGRLYDYEWKNSAGVVQNPTAEVVNGVYTITLSNVPADSYFLTIKDKNYNQATSQTTNCSVIESEIKLTQPDPLKVVFEVIKTISCNAGNEYGDKTDTTPNDGQRDESQDGILKAHVTGGTPLASNKNGGLPYYFYWKKQQDDGTWKDLGVQDSIISNLSYGNYALNVKDRNDVILGTYTNGNWIAKDSIQFMDQPPVLSVKIEKGDVFCNGGNDGWATATAEGGSGYYTYKWSNEFESDKNTILKTGTYWVIVTDKRGCTAYAEVFINEPKKPLAIKYKDVVNPSFYKATNGKIVVEVTGGTIAADNTYWFEWKNSKGVIQTTTTTSFANDIYTISLNGLGEETYTLTVRDANYNAATNKTSCTVANLVTELDDPDPLEVTFEVIRTISCNVSNEFGNETDANPLDNQRDESQDGILKANVKGGIQLPANKNNRLPYYYTWKKKQKDGSWTLWNNTGDTAEYLSEGTYALNIEDANGIKLGTYVNNVLVEEKDAEKYIPQPDPLKLSFTKFDVGCTTGDDGWVEAHVTGGTPPYTYEWTNGETTSKIENITTNNYFVIVKDDKGCVVQGSIFVGDPNGILTTETVKDPICYQGNDGSIELNVTGGNLSYTYLWNTGAVTKDLNNLTAGNYEVTITCPDCCVYKKRFVLKDPQPVIVNIGADRTLCIDQSLDLNASIADPKAQYSWTSTNGFTSNEAKINVSKAGTYRVKVTSGLGCIGEDEIVIKTSQMAISAEFLLSSQAYLDEEVILVNTSNPFGESTDWVIPKGVKIVEQKEKFITLKFDAAGVYSIGLQQTQGECYAVYTKNITVEKRGTLPNTGTTSQFVLDFIVTPNPSDGNFKAIVNLENNSAINLRLFSSAGQNTMIQKQESGKKKYEVDFNTSLSSGIYVLVLETGQQTLVKKIIIY